MDISHHLSWLNKPLQTWLEPLKIRPYPLNPKLDCERCTRSLKATETAEKVRWRNYKCCTFQPFLPNFLLGSILETRELPQKQTSYSPLGLMPTPDYRKKLEGVQDEKRGVDQVCAFYNRARRACEIWSQRPSECALYFCETNSFFTKRSQDLFEWEMAVAHMALLEHGYLNREIEELKSWLEWEFEPSVHARWKHYANRENELYRSCFEWTKKVTAEDVLSWLPKEAKASFDTWLRIP